jgi:hypothetical protein
VEVLMYIDELDQAIKAACPIDGINSAGAIFFKAEATDDQKKAAQQIMDRELPTLNPKSAPPLDAFGFAQACKAAAGGIVQANALAVAYPLFFDAVAQQQWSDVQALILDAQAKSVINAQQYAAFKAAAAAHNIPINLP